MPQITLACYSIRVRERSTHDFLKFDDPKIAGLFTLIEDYLKSRAANTTIDQNTKKVLSVRSHRTVGEEITGILETGEYGYESKLIDVAGKAAPYHRKASQAEILPFFFHIYIPKDEDCGILILQRFGVFGVRSILTRDLTPIFDAKYPGCSLNIWPQVPEGVLDALMESGELKKITLRRLSLPSDVADSIDDKMDEDAARMDIVIAGKRSFSFGKILKAAKRWMKNRTPLPLSEVIHVDGFAPDRLLLDIQVGTRHKTVDLTNLKKLRAYIDVTEDVSIGADGHPTLDSIKAESQDVLKGLRDTLQI